VTTTAVAIADTNSAITPRLERLLQTYRRWLHLPDPDVILATFGAIAANHQPGDPTWLALVGPPGSGKTEALQPTVALEHVHAVSTLTKASLLSGTAKKEQAKDSKGGLLNEIGEFGIIVIKDFTSILSLHP
jgi:hypothetical protein